MKTRLLLVFGLLLTFCSYQAPQRTLAEIAPAPCIAGSTSARFGFWNWPPDSQVNVYLRTPDFAEDDAQAVGTALQNWDAAAIENGSNVHFTLKGLTNAARTSQGDLTLIRNPIYNKKDRHLALLEAHSLRSDQLINWGLIIVDPRVKEGEVLTNVIAHEIGHTLGLLDCYHCQKGSTAMGLLKNADESNGINGPTACDKVIVLAAYQELKIHVAQAPAQLKPIETVDEGTDPEADDTPIVPVVIAPGKPKAVAVSAERTKHP